MSGLPFFPGVTRDIVEHAIAGTHAGEPVAADSPDGRNLTYTLEGRCSNWFQVHSNGQIVLAAGKTLDYKQAVGIPPGPPRQRRGERHRPGRHVLDDDSIPLTINVIDTPDNAVHPTVTFVVSDFGRPGGGLRYRPAEGASEGQHHRRGTQRAQRAKAELRVWSEDGYFDPSPRTSTYHAYGNQPGTTTYTVHVSWPGGGITASKTVQWYSN